MCDNVPSYISYPPNYLNCFKFLFKSCFFLILNTDMKNLKKLAAMLMLAMLVTFTFTSCGNDDKDDEPINSGTTQSKSLIGRWILVSCENVYKVNGTIVDRNVAYDGSIQFEFKNNGIFKLIEGDEIEEGTYFSNDNALILQYDVDESEVFTIQSLTSSELKLQDYDSWYDSGDFTEFIGTYTFMKVK